MDGERAQVTLNALLMAAGLAPLDDETAAKFEIIFRFLFAGMSA
jgi:hypothetical protein